VLAATLEVVLEVTPALVEVGTSPSLQPLHQVAQLPTLPEPLQETVASELVVGLVDEGSVVDGGLAVVEDVERLPCCLRPLALHFNSERFKM